MLNDHAILARVLAAAGSCAGMSTIRAVAPGSGLCAVGLCETGRDLDRGRLLAPPFGEAKGGKETLPLHDIPHRHRPRPELLAAHQLQVHHLGKSREQGWPATDDAWMHHELVLIDET